MKAHIGVDAGRGLGHMVVGPAVGVNAIAQPHAPAHGDETEVFADADCQGGDRREHTQEIRTHWHVALHPVRRGLLDTTDPKDAIADPMAQVEASIRSKVEYPFRVTRRQFGHLRVRWKVRYRGLARSTA